MTGERDNPNRNPASLINDIITSGYLGHSVKQILGKGGRRVNGQYVNIRQIWSPNCTVDQGHNYIVYGQSLYR